MPRRVSTRSPLCDSHLTRNNKMKRPGSPTDDEALKRPWRHGEAAEEINDKGERGARRTRDRDLEEADRDKLKRKNTPHA